MVTGREKNKNLYTLAETHAPVRLFFINGCMVDAIVLKAMEECVKIKLDDEHLEMAMWNGTPLSEYYDNGDCFSPDFDDILGYELR